VRFVECELIDCIWRGIVPSTGPFSGRCCWMREMFHDRPNKFENTEPPLVEHRFIWQ
jgi:hypothetical protein